MTCVPFAGGILCLSDDVGPYRISDGASSWWFEWSDRWGPLRVRKDGGSANQPSAKSRFWAITCLWNRQGRRLEGSEAVYENPKPITHYWKRSGRSRIVVGTLAPEGSDPDYSEEIFVEVAGTPSRDTRRMAETGTGSVRSTSGANSSKNNHPSISSQGS